MVSSSFISKSMDSIFHLQKKTERGKKNRINIRKKATLLDGTYTIFIIKKETKMYVIVQMLPFFHCIVEVRG
jgi:hypothetical protein